MVVISLLVLLDDGEDLLHVLPAPEEDGAALVQLGGPEDKNKRDGMFVFFGHPGCSSFAYTIPFGTLDTSL